jgi:hypothetical protein
MAGALGTESISRQISALSPRGRVCKDVPKDGTNTCASRGQQAPNKGQTRDDQAVIQVANRQHGNRRPDDRRR